MPLPSNVGTGTVVGRFVDINGDPVDGEITFTASPKKLLNATAVPPTTILPKPVVVPVVDGAFAKELVATNDVDNNPEGWTWRVEFALTGVTVDPFSIPLPAGATVDLTVDSPVPPSNGVPQVRGAGVPAGGTPGQVLLKASGTDYDTLWGAGGGGGGSAVVSVNDQIGEVVLDADDIADGTTRVTMTTGERAKLAGVTPGATANASDASLLNRTNHTGSQAQSTIVGLVTALAAKLGFKGNTYSLTDPTNDQVASVTIEGDGTSQSAWVNRLEWLFRPNGGTAKLVSWFNEYAEFRVTPAKSNTVAFRAFGKTAPADPAHTGPVLEVQDDRTTRTSLWSVDAEGDMATGAITAAGAVTAANLPPAILVLDAADPVPGGTPSGAVILRTP